LAAELTGAFALISFAGALYSYFWFRAAHWENVTVQASAAAE